MFVEIMAFLLKIFASHYCVEFFHIFPMIVQSYIKAFFSLPTFYLLSPHQIYNIAMDGICLVLVLAIVCICIFLTLFFQS